MMKTNLLANGNLLDFIPGIPAGFGGPILPEAVIRQASGVWGHLCLQEVVTRSVCVSHTWVEVKEDVVITDTEVRPGLQSLVAVKGSFEYAVQGLKRVLISEKEFVLFSQGNMRSELSFQKGRYYSLFHACYDTEANAGILSYFPVIQKSLQRSFTRAVFYLKKPIATRYSVLDTIQAIFYDRYIPMLEKAYIESRMKTNLLTLLAQADAPALRKPPSAAKQAKAGAARSLMLENPLKRLTIEEIAKVLHCSPSSVKKAFGNVYGKGMYEFLREQRMLIAKERLLKGESLKVVAIEMGINPRDFPKEFKLFFGYTITALINGSQ